MAIACESCTEPVHEDVVVCPHCGRRSGARPSEPTASESREAAAEILATDLAYIPPTTVLGHAISGPTPDVALVSLGFELIGAVLGTVADKLSSREPIPEAIAHVRPTREVQAIKSAPPEPVDPTDPSEPPRFLK